MVSKAKPNSLSPTVQHSQRKMLQDPALSDIPISLTSDRLLLLDFLDNKKRKGTKIDDEDSEKENLKYKQIQTVHKLSMPFPNSKTSVKYLGILGRASRNICNRREPTV